MIKITKAEKVEPYHRLDPKDCIITVQIHVNGQDWASSGDKEDLAEEIGRKVVSVIEALE